MTGVRAPLPSYLLGTGTWFAAFGMQSVLFAWLVTIVLHEPAQNVGIAQMALLLPGTLLLLVGGGFADRYGGRRVAVTAQLTAALAPALLALALYYDALTFSVMLAYALLLGTAQAFVTPGRDSLLNQVAAGRVQRAVMLASIAQFGMQTVGALSASLADWIGPVPLLLAQALLLVIGALGFARIENPAVTAPDTTPPPTATRPPSLVALMSEGARTVSRQPALRMIVLQNMAMALCFMGSFIVTIPLVVREVFDGTATDLSWVNATNSAGLVTTILVLLRFGGIHHQGRALILSQVVGCFALGASAFMPTYWGFVGVLFLWGICGGVAMTMSRTIMQEQAPAAMRGRVMSIYGLSFMGAGPVGALLCGYLAGAFGPQEALLLASGAMLLIVVVVALRSGLWQVQSTEYAPA